MPTLPNILLLILDSARAKNMSLYGYERETTPFLDEFSNQATLYTQARAPGIHSVASHASIFTGQEVDRHGAIKHASEINPSDTIWHDLATNYSYTTGLFTSNLIVADASNLYEAFDHVDRPRLSLTRAVRKKLFKSAYAPFDSDDSLGLAGNIRQALRDNQPLRSFLNCS